MFKVGDKVKIKRGIHNLCEYKVGKIYTIAKIDHRASMSEYTIKLESENAQEDWKNAELEFAHKKIGEVEWLDAIQYNFKDGV